LFYPSADEFAFIRGWSNQIVTWMTPPSTKPQVGNDFRWAREITEVLLAKDIFKAKVLSRRKPTVLSREKINMLLMVFRKFNHAPMIEENLS
jgi:hypothetical protein